MNIVMGIMNIVLGIAFGYLAICILYNFVFAISAQFRNLKKYTSCTKKNNFAILIPTYKDNNVILNTVNNVLRQDYPADKYQVIVIADQLDSEILVELSRLPIRLITVSFSKSTKAKSLKFALAQLPCNIYDSILILDSDNLLEKGCLEKANHALNDGYKMVQLHRTAKNKNTATAILDAISEEVGNAIHREGQRALGFSATLIGSGMAFDFNIFKSIMMNLDIEGNPAEDREINTEFLRRGYKCEYIEDALVFDEKVASNFILQQQRTRWISAQFMYARKFWLKELKKTITTNANYLNYALQTLILPRSMLIVTTFFLGIVSLLLLLWNKKIYLGPIHWLCLLIIMIVSISISIGNNISKSEFKTALLHFPITFIAFFKAFRKSSSRQSDFIHTPKEFVN